MADIRSDVMSAGDLRKALAALPSGTLGYLIQRLYGRIVFVTFSAEAICLGECMDGRAFGDAGEVTWQRLDNGQFQVCVVWDVGDLPHGFEGGCGLPYGAELTCECSSIFLWGTRIEGQRKWFEARVARAELAYPLPGFDPLQPAIRPGYRVKATIVRYRDANGELVAWRMKGLKAVTKAEVSKQ